MVISEKPLSLSGSPWPASFRRASLRAVGGHHYGVGAGLHPVGDGGGIQCLGDLRLVFGRKICIQHAEVWAARPQHHGDAGGDRRGDAYQQQYGAQTLGPARVNYFGRRRRTHSELRELSVLKVM